MSGTNAWTRSRERMRRFPELLAACAGEAAEYGKCVCATAAAGSGKELRKDLCAKEFEALKACFRSAAKKTVT
ncbi:NADH dehydrogenase [ubiquinone] 1 alpha subcomplex assembly factor 8 [Scleropages formosus]|uniref:NADH:ubiquinone oxidoreductase complex assembly factor 8 n=1 Tax=Scleropages formosus TaxID=113540 RepID=A0A8C9QXF8_SCLFO|nr:NADH dehydrogenase [ubiquinone] 1 alpha subcomplex assembly factor 8 [Scleropages formosus]